MIFISPFKIHIDSIKISFSLLAKKNFLVFLVPASLLTLFYLMLTFIPSLFLGDWTTIDSDSNWFVRSFSSITNILSALFQQLYIFIVLTIFSPFNTILSEKVEAYLTNKVFKFDLIATINDFFRMIYIVVSALLLQSIFLLSWWLFSSILNITDTPIYQLISYLISAFFLGFSFYDYTLERQRFSVKKSYHFAFSNILLITLSGIIFKLLYNFPYFWAVSYIGIIFAPVFTTIMTTICYLKQENKLEKNN